ncbi:MAG TPA: hypothetical protein DGT23_32455 [Micromonosporaceae bacterium]|nr:hypothetical protein [Micromonosporaceae bacterium]
MRRITMDDGVQLAVRETGNPNGPTVVCVHGFPDNSRLWDGVAERLASRFRVIVYDVRGAGQSDRPKETKAYLLERLAADLATVIQEVSPKEDVHLLAHDWGSIQVWHALGRGQKAASFTSISGPDLDRAGEWIRAQARRPRAWGRLAKQLASSTYIVFFQVPRAAELASRAGLISRMLRRPVDHDDFRHGLKLYRANMFRRLTRPRPAPVKVRTQILVPTRDRFVGAGIQNAEGASIRSVDAGHWLPLSQPLFVAECVEEFIV